MYQAISRGPALIQALTYCDMTTGPDGVPLDVADRLAEIHSRYGSVSRWARLKTGGGVPRPELDRVTPGGLVVAVLK
jgi:hypothetical protein